MIGLLCFVLAVLASPFKSKLRLEAENAVLRHQLNVVRRRLPGRVRLTNHDYYSGKWHLGDVAEFYPIEHGFDEMKHFGAYYPGVYAYSDTSPDAHPWFPKYNAAYWAMYQKAVNLYEWSGTAGKPAIKGEIITWTIFLTSMCGRPIRRSLTSSSMPKTASLSSWTSTS